MESIEEQWNPPTSTDIFSESWINIAAAKRGIKIRILDSGVFGSGSLYSKQHDSTSTSLPVFCLLLLYLTAMIYANLSALPSIPSRLWLYYQEPINLPLLLNSKPQRLQAQQRSQQLLIPNSIPPTPLGLVQAFCFRIGSLFTANL